MKKTPRALSVWTAAICLAAAAFAFAGTTGKPRIAPLNPKFVEYVQARALSRAVQATAEGHAFGEVPRPFLGSTVRPSLNKRDRAGFLPVTFDLRSVPGKLPGVRDQGGCGSCWAFATYGTLESVLRPGEVLDLSEQHLIDNAGFSLGPCAGGNIYMSMAYLARWAGPVAEVDDPYDHLASIPDSAAAVRKHVQSATFLPIRASSLDNDLIKSFVMSDGVVYVSMLWVGSGYNAARASFYNNGVTAGGEGHAVGVVGWDDDYPAANFNVAPPGNGAFIVRNSWGSSWGESGYFYVSYHDTQFGRRDPTSFGATIKAEDAGNYSRVFQYDPLGWVNDLSVNGTETGWAANVFTAPTKTSLSAVGFYTVSPNCAYEVYIYTGATAANPRAGTLRAATSGASDLPAYVTIPLPSPVTVLAGQKFSVVIRFTTPGYVYPVPIEMIISGYSGPAVAHAGEGLFSANGTAWTDPMKAADLSAYNINFCIKAYAATVPKIAVTDPAAGARWMRGTTQTINWTRSGTQADTVKIQLFRDATKVSDITLSTGNDGAFDWAIPANLAPRTGFTIRVTTTDGKIKGTSGKFAIVKPTLTVTAPAASAVWTRGTTRAILWTRNGPQNELVRIQLIRYGVLVKEISPSTANSGTFDWAIPANLPRGAGFKVRVRTVDNLVRDDSALFTLR